MDKFEIVEGSNSRQLLYVKNLAVETGLEPTSKPDYRCDVIYSGELKSGIEPFKEIQFPLPLIEPDSTAYDEDTLWELRIYKRRGDSNGKWMKPVNVYLRLDKASGKFALVGVRH